MPNGTSLEDLTDLVTPEQNVGIASKEVLTDQKMCKISATITNVGLSAGYYVRELGVFANDPDDGEILYAVTSDSAPDYIPPEGGSTAVSQEFAVYISASNASDVKVSIDPGALATMGYVEIAIADHNSLATAHENRFKLFEKSLILAMTSSKNWLLLRLSQPLQRLKRIRGLGSCSNGINGIRSEVQYRHERIHLFRLLFRRANYTVDN